MKPRKCVWCGKEFIPNSPRQTSCGDTHYRPCIDCGKLIEVKESYKNYMKSGGRRCSECRAKAIKQARISKTKEEKQRITEKTRSTCRAKYGVDNPMQCKEIQKRSKETIKKKYGVDNVSQSAEIQRRIRENSIKRYGVAHYTQSPDIRKHMIEGMIKKYGDICPSRVPEIRKKTIATNRKRYHVDNVGQSSEIKQRMKETCKRKYGVDYALQADIIRQKIKSTCRQKYGCYGSPPKLFLDKLKDEKFRTRYSEFIDDPRKYIQNHYGDIKISLSKLTKDLELDYSAVCNIIDNNNAWDTDTKHISSMEVEIVDYLKSIDESIQINLHNRQLIRPYEIDIFLPEYSLAIECDPTFTHNSSFKSFGDTEPITSSYHKKKTDLCESAGIFLFHIFGYEWTNKKSIVLSMLRNLINKNSNKIYARRCIIKPVDDKECARFLNENHRQGYCKSLIRLGLYYQNNLVSLMTFGHTRVGLGKLKADNNETYELLRFCNRLNTSVIGGASKLFSYFLETTNVSKIVSFSDRAHTRGHLYKTLGFHSVSTSQPGYVWVNTYNDSYYHRVECQKKNLKRLFNDDSIDIENKTEAMIMMEHGYCQVFDSGTIRWEFDN